MIECLPTLPARDTLRSADRNFAQWRAFVTCASGGERTCWTCLPDMPTSSPTTAAIDAGMGRRGNRISARRAGYDGFRLHRQLEALGIRNYVIDPASLQVDRRARRVKTDRIDTERLLRSLMAYLRGEPKVWSAVRVPSSAEEDARRLHRKVDFSEGFRACRRRQGCQLEGAETSVRHRFWAALSQGNLLANIDICGRAGTKAQWRVENLIRG